MVWVWFEGHTQLFICCQKLAPVTRGTMPCQTHEWAFGASIRSFFLNSLGEKQDPSPFFIYFLFASCLQLAPVTRVKPCQTHEWAFGASLRHSAFLLFLYFFVFFVFYDFYVSIKWSWVVRSKWRKRWANRGFSSVYLYSLKSPSKLCCTNTHEACYWQGKSFLQLSKSFCTARLKMMKSICK